MSGWSTLIGVVVGAFLAGTFALVTEQRKGRGEVKRRRQDALRVACSDFTAALVRIRYLSWTLEEHPRPGPADDVPASRARADATRDAVLERIRASEEEARIGFERLRLVSGTKATQENARLALRHIYAVWRKAETGKDPRADDPDPEYRGEPRDRFNRRLDGLYVAVREELDVPDPENVYPEPP
jgi:hypothetical protein